MKLEGQKSGSGFKAWGKGFIYEYNAPRRELFITHALKGQLLVALPVDRRLSRRVHEYVRLLEKTTQIKALIFSNNNTVDLSQTFDNDKLIILLQSSAALAGYAFDLTFEKYRHFERNFCAQFGLLSLKIRKIESYGMEDDFYAGKLETLRKLTVDARHKSLNTTILSLSERILHDLIARELTLPSQSAAYSLLKISSELATIAHVINHDFDPMTKIIHEKAPLRQLKGLVLQARAHF